MEAIARLRNYPTSPTKMRLVADLIRNMDVEKALIELQFNAKHSSVPLKKLLLSAVNNWKQANQGVTEENLYVKTIFVDSARVLKRMLPAPQGRAYRIKKRSNHVTLIVDQRVTEGTIEEPKTSVVVADPSEGTKTNSALKDPKTTISKTAEVPKSKDSLTTLKTEGKAEKNLNNNIISNNTEK